MGEWVGAEDELVHSDAAAIVASACIFHGGAPGSTTDRSLQSTLASPALHIRRNRPDVAGSSEQCLSLGVPTYVAAQMWDLERVKLTLWHQTYTQSVSPTHTICELSAS